MVHGKIYAIGGCQGSAGPGLSVVEVYDPSADAWTTAASMPTARFMLFTGVVDGKIYAFGGGDVYPVKNALDVVEAYDPSTDTWTTKTAMPSGRMAMGHSSRSIDGRIYVLGGRGLTVEDAFADMYEYEPGLDVQ